MLAAEITEGLARLGIVHHTTLAYSAYQNGKAEALWGSVEGRLMAMLEDVADLTLASLNEATQAWCEHEYNRTVHAEIGQMPLARFLAGPEVLRPSPDSEALRLAFTRTDTAHAARRATERSSLEARRFEVPNRYRHLRRIAVRYAELGSEPGASASMSAAARSCAACIRRTSRPTPAACAARSSRWPQAPRRGPQPAPTPAPRRRRDRPRR